MTPADKTYITIGKVGATYGVRGWIKIHAYTEHGPSIIDYQPWYFKQGDNDWELKVVESCRMHGKGIIAKFADINSPEEARLLTGNIIGVRRSQLPTLNENEYLWSDLIGLTVFNKNGENLGKVTYLIATGSNDVLVVKGEKEQAIPYLFGSVVTKVDLAKQEIHVDWELL